MNWRTTFLYVAVLGGAALVSAPAQADEKGVDWKTLQGAKVSLEKGLTAAEQKGRPISGKFEVEDGKLQLSVYTSGKGKFWEVIVDHTSGRVSKTEEIKEGDDLAAAKTQNEAMARAKKSLSSAARKATAVNAGYRVLSVVPSLENGKPVAAIVLENSAGTKTVSESLE